MNRQLFTRDYWLDTFERVVATTAQAGVAAFGLDQVTPDIHLEARDFVVFMAFAALAALLKCLAAVKVGAGNTAAMLPIGPDTERGAIDKTFVVLCVIAVCIVVTTWHYLGIDLSSP